MAYKLPKDLKYKEKVIGNLTWKQTIYTLTGITLSLSTLLLQIPLIAKALLSSTLILSSLILAFTSLENGLKDRIIYMRSVKEAGYLDQEAYNFLEIEKLEKNGVALRNDGTRIAFLEVEPVNLQIKTKKEKEEITEQYESFLNSIQFPIHINIKTIDTITEIEDYFDQLQNKENQVKSLQDYRKNYREYWENYIQDKGVKTRKYYIIIPSNHKNREEAHRQLERRTELVREKLPAQIPSKRMNKSQITRMLASYFGNLVQHQNNYYSPFTLPPKNSTNN